MKSQTESPCLENKKNSAIRFLLILSISFVAYYFSARMGLELATINNQASPVWPATGIAMTLALMWGAPSFLGIFLGAFLANYETGLNLTATTLISTGNVLESAAFLWLTQKYILKHKEDGIHSLALFCMLAIIFGCAASATAGTGALWLTSVISAKDLVDNWITWWIGDFLGGALIAPLALLAKTSTENTFAIRKRDILSLALVTFTAVSTSYVVFSTNLGKPLLFLLFVPVLLSANILRPTWTHILCIGLAIHAILQTLLGEGPFSGSDLNQSLLHLQSFLGGLGLVAMGMSSLKKTGLTYRINTVLIVGWIFSGATFYYAQSVNENKIQSEFKERTNKAKSAIEATFQNYVQMLESGVSFFKASNFVSKEEWNLFATHLISHLNHQKAEGFGVIFSELNFRKFDKSSSTSKYVPPKNFKNIRNRENLIQDVNPDENFVITYFVPQEKESEFIGINISTEEKRFSAAAIARDTGLPQVTEKIYLLGDTTQKLGYSIYAPIYAGGTTPFSVTEKRKNLIGFVYASFSLEELLTKALKEFSGEIEWQIIKPTDHKQILLSSRKNIDQGNSTHDEVSFLNQTLHVDWSKGRKYEAKSHLESAWVSFLGAIAPLFLALVLSSLQNIAARANKIADEMTVELKERKRAWQLLTEISPVGVFTTDKFGRCNYVNKMALKLSGLTMHEAMSKNWIHSIHPEDRQRVQGHWLKLVADSTLTCEYRFLRKDESIVYVQLAAIPITDENNLIAGYLATLQDITEIRNNQMSMLASAKMSSLGEMASGIAHEINNPLAIIVSKAAIIEKTIEKNKFDPEKAKADLKLISDTGLRIAKIIKGLRSFARDTSGETFQAASVKEVINDTLGLCRERFKHHDIRLEEPLELDSSLSFYGRPEQICQVLVNLLNNALDAANTFQGEKWVSISVTHEKDKIKIAVADSGAGIEKEIQKSIFNPFFTTKDVGKGTGLGLSISKGIVEKHDGKLYIDDSKKNTTFVVELAVFGEGQKVAS